jgi:hypothetical protein
VVDGRKRSDNYTRNEIRMMHAEGVLRALCEIVRRGYALTKEE